MAFAINKPAPAAQSVTLCWHCIVVAVSLGFAGFIDCVTGYEISVFVLYVLPVGLATRFFGAWMGVSVSLLATGVWMWADRWAGHAYSHEWIFYINAFNRMLCFLLAVGAIRYVRLRNRRFAEALRAFGGTPPICTQCHRIGSADGYWRTFESYLIEHGGAAPQHKVCPDCARRVYARAGYRGG